MVFLIFVILIAINKGNLLSQTIGYFKKIPSAKVDTTTISTLVQVQEDHVLLVNGTPDTISYFGEMGRLRVRRNIQDKQGKWHDLDANIFCGTGYGFYRLPPYCYSWIEKHQPIFRESDSSLVIKTNIRYCVDTGESTLLCSRPQIAIVDKFRFLPYNLMKYYLRTRFAKNKSANRYRYRIEEKEKQIELWYKKLGLD